MSNYDNSKFEGSQEQLINALLDGELGEADAEDLKAAASDDRDLARAIIEAYQLQQAMETIQVEKAPASLRKRLKAIPREQRRVARPKILQPRWAMALAAVPLAIIAVSLMQPDTPTASEIAKARQEMAIAFAYLDKAGLRTGQEIEIRVGDTVTDAVTGSVIRTLKSQNQSFKENEV